MAWNWRNLMDARNQDREIRQAIDSLDDRVQAATPSAAGQLYLLAASAAFSDLDSATWVPITQYDATIPANASEAKGMTLDPVNGTLTLNVPGLWRLDFTFSMTHNENNAGRTLELRTYNVTDGVGGDVVSVAIGRNQPGTSYAINTLLDIADTDINKPVRIEAKMATGSAGMTSITFTELGYIGTYTDSFADMGDIGALTVDAQSRYVEAAYGGMRFYSATAVPSTIGTTPVKITLYNEELPRFGTSLHVKFDADNDEVVILLGQSGVYEVSLYMNFVGEQGETYDIQLYLDSGSGPQPVGNVIKARVSNQDPNAELQLSTMGLLQGGGRWSVWVNADKNNTRFDVFSTSLYFFRISGRFDGPVPTTLDLGNGIMPWDDDDDDDED